MTDANRQPRSESDRQHDESNRQHDERGDELGGYRTAMDVQETTMDQGQQAIRRTAELQRSFAQAALRGIENQQAAQRQAFEFTKAAIGSYVDTMNSMLPAIEDAQQQFAREAASAGDEMTDQFQETTREMGQRSEQFGQQMGQQRQQTGQRTSQQAQRHVDESSQQTSGAAQQTGQRPGQQFERRTADQSSGTGQPESGGFQRADAPHERGIQPPSSGQRGGGHQPPRQSGTQSQPQQTTRASPSQPGPSGRERDQPQSRSPGTTGRSGEPTEDRRPSESRDRTQTGRGQSEFRGSRDRDEPSERSGGRTSPTHQERREPPQTTRSGEEPSQREIPISSSPERPHSPSQKPNTEYGTRSGAGSESNEDREEPPE